MSMIVSEIVCAPNLELFSAGREKLLMRMVQCIFDIIMARHRTKNLGVSC